VARGRDTDWRVYAAKVAAVAGAYWASAKLGLNLAFETPSVTAVWPPTGIALAALILGGFRLWPGVALGALLANSWTGIPLHSTLGITVGNTLEAVVGAYLLVRVADFRPSLERVRDVIALVVLAGVVSTTVSATIGTTSLLAGDEIAGGDFGSVWRTWWLGDMGGDLVVAPAIMIAATHWPFRRPPGRLFEGAALLVLLGTLAALVFSQDEETRTAFPYQIFPLLIWAALRFWQLGAIVASLVLASVAIPLSEADLGPFAGDSPDERLLLTQLFVGIAGITALVLAAVITERRRAEDAVVRIADTLQESLLPSGLPEIPGVEMAIDFRPAGEGQIVGGDFYDLFRATDGSWGIVVGDVKGKGARAAATTALARYTLRAAAEHERLPSRILALLNDAILRQSPGESCTIAYVRLEQNGAGAGLTLCVGGHPLPLVLRAGGAVEPVGRPGTPLGVLPQPELSDRSAHLAPGDTLVLYTDGLTEAHAPDLLLTESDLAAILGPCVGQSAPDIVARIEREIIGDLEVDPRDDLALLVLRVLDGRAAEAATANAPA
jgi:integral membrane sensor domain MASE1